MKVVEHRNMFWRLEKHAKTTANTRMQPKILSLLIYEVLIDNTLDRVAMFFSDHPYLESTAVLSDTVVHTCKPSLVPTLIIII